MDRPDAYYQDRKVHIIENMVNPLRIVQACAHGTVSATPKTIERALFYIIGDQLKEAVRRVVRDMEYPAIVGPVMPRRLAEIEKLTKENSELQAKVAEIESGLKSELGQPQMETAKSALEALAFGRPIK